MFFTTEFFLSWLAFLIFANKQQAGKLLPICTFAGFLGSTTDSIMDRYKLWAYTPDSIIADLFNDWGVFPVVTYLFLQSMPKEKTFKKMLFYWVEWTTVTFCIEYLHVKTGHIHYFKWWNIWWSYLSDWILFWIFYISHIFLKKLSSKPIC